MLPTGKRAWQQDARVTWQSAISSEIDLRNTRVNLGNYLRRYTIPSERHMVLEASDAVARRDLLAALKQQRSHIRAYPHLSPMSRANKTLVYYQANKKFTQITDKGDLLIVAWKHCPTTNVVLEMI